MDKVTNVKKTKLFEKEVFNSINKNLSKSKSGKENKEKKDNKLKSIKVDNKENKLGKEHKGKKNNKLKLINKEKKENNEYNITQEKYDEDEIKNVNFFAVYNNIINIKSRFKS